MSGEIDLSEDLSGVQGVYIGALGEVNCPDGAFSRCAVRGQFSVECQLDDGRVFGGRIPISSRCRQRGGGEYTRVILLLGSVRLS